MLNKSLLALAIASFSSSATALPALPPTGYSHLHDVVEAKIVCYDDGLCRRPPQRRPTARWVYGDDAFVGPYRGPGYYGPPGWHWRWFPFFGF